MDKVKSYNRQLVAQEVVNVLAKHGVWFSAISDVFECVQEEAARQLVQAVEVKEG